MDPLTQSKPSISPASPAKPANPSTKVTITADDALRAQAARLGQPTAQVAAPKPAAPAPLKLEDEFDTMDMFERKVTVAHANGHKYVETTANILNQYFPKGLGDCKYGIYRNVRVCLKGKSEEIENEEEHRSHEGNGYIRA